MLEAFVEGGAKKRRKPRTVDATDRARARAYHCARCTTRICDESDAVGGGTHRFTNPAGFAFDVACFAAAPGCRVDGEPTLEYTWFPGHAWSIADCRNCSAQLGWFFSGESTFYGLILERLIGPT